MKYDLIVVGAGVLGTFHAYHAAKLGKNVLLLEKDAKQKGSSTQNFGQVVPSGLSSTWNKYGQRSLVHYLELQQKADFTIRQQGSVYIASDDAEQGLLEELREIHSDEGYLSLMFSQKGVKERFPDLNPAYIKSGLFYPQELSVDPREMVNRVSEYLKETGRVHVHYNQKVVATIQKITGCEVETEDGNIYDTEQVIVCCGYSFESLYPAIFAESNIKISKLQMLKTKPLTGINLKSNILTGLTIRRYESFTECDSFQSLETPESYQELKEKGIHILFKQADDGSIIIGDSHEYAGINGIKELGCDSNPEIDDLIMTEARRILALPEDCIAERWAGFYGQHEDDIFVHDVEKCIKIITGIGGKGMTSAAGYAEASIRSLYQV
ncbi:TIGR03364 family FAD-dependent oxidoreductase [Arcticibacterium luteifluviistationis]|uniref:TIGR03364 family FAD-dependent oxidoreductase n=1 Tax=Arcticibacterium luteifluviistationis TaxID=1784714 RepID=A0A2Z4GGQ0_9BACT|nr:TIGR03364 family FAD-dependent oxidoreductase [Arcticibacterium luteifluviistationis]AWW00362.1 TIGR03364 family FAD-dependent oxidoreductase [Arcticibacterium luteifluviistationis]